jgi:hypothetical protein
MKKHSSLKTHDTRPIRSSFARHDYNHAWTGLFVDELLGRASPIAWLEATNTELKEQVKAIRRDLMLSSNDDFHAIKTLFGNIKPPPTVRAVRRWLTSLPPGVAYWDRRLVRLTAALHQDEMDPEQLGGTTDLAA